MTRKVIRTDKAPSTVSPYSQGFRAGAFIYTAGQVGIDPKTGEIPEGFSDQVKQALTNIKAILEAEGATMDDVVKTTVIISDIKFFQEMNEAYKAFFSEPYPARTTIGAALPSRRMMVEIDAIAYKPVE